MDYKSSYEKNVKKWKKAYTDILKVCEKYNDFEEYAFYDIKDMAESARNHLLLIDWYENYGLKINHDKKSYTFGYFSVEYGENKKFLQFGDAAKDRDAGGGRYIAWSDDDRQPLNEWLFNVVFPSGAWVFGEGHATSLFQEFFRELKSYKPDYIDNYNRSLYWKLENAKPIFDEFDSIFKKYKDRYASGEKQRRADKLRKELEKLEAES